MYKIVRLHSRRIQRRSLIGSTASWHHLAIMVWHVINSFFCDSHTCLTTLLKVSLHRQHRWWVDLGLIVCITVYTLSAVA